MFGIVVWTLIYDLAVAASILLLGNPATLLGHITPKTLLMLVFDWRFMLGAVLAVGARFIFVIINNLASKNDTLSHAHLSLTAIASMTSIIMVLVVNHFVLGDRFTLIQLLGIGIVLLGFFFIFK
jgi:drug/metabolite transporter (DMT)-like permease